MKKEYLKIICCPICKGDLELLTKKEKKEEIIEGFLVCKRCNKNYPVEKGILNLLP